MSEIVGAVDLPGFIAIIRDEWPGCKELTADQIFRLIRHLAFTHLAGVSKSK